MIVYYELRAAPLFCFMAMYSYRLLLLQRAYSYSIIAIRFSKVSSRPIIAIDVTVLFS
jgi:hypothetical protein